MRRWLVAGVLAVMAVGAGCGGGTDEVAAPSPRADTATSAGPAADPTGGVERQVVRYHGLELTVPASWPVYDLVTAPTTCVRFDVNAVYLGSPSPDMECPAQLIGRVDAVLVEPGAEPSVSVHRDLGGATAAEVNDLAVAIDSSRAVEHELVVGVPQAGVTVTMTFGESDAVAQQVVASMRAAR
jgi:hypothetical protein